MPRSATPHKKNTACVAHTVAAPHPIPPPLTAELIGSTAGLVWRFLDQNGSATALGLKSALGISNTVLYLALGWLAREDKIAIAESAAGVTVTLKPHE